MFQSNQLKLELIGLEKADVVQEIYKHSPTYFRRVDGTDPLPSMAEKDILDRPPKRAEAYIKAPVLIYENLNPIAYADLHINYRSKGIAYLGLLILREDSQGRGLGRKAYFAVQDFLQEKFDIEKIYLGVSNRNQVQGFWEKMGFKSNGFTYSWQGETVTSEVTEMEKVIGPQILRLERPSESLFKEFSIFIDEMRANKQPLWEPYLPQANEEPHDFVNRLLKREIEPEGQLVAETVYWATFDGHVVGRISLRDHLEGNLHKIGGHIGYEVSPKWRRKGFATEMLRQILLTDKAKKIGRLLLTCSPKNEASNKTIISNNGKFTQTIFVEMIREERNHYWIDLQEQGSIIRRARAGDEAAIAKVHIKSWQEAYAGLIPQSYLDQLPSEHEDRVNLWKKIIANPRRWAWVAENENGIVGFALFGPPRDPNREGYIELGAIYLRASEKNKKIGFSLLSEGFQEMQRRGYKRAYCWVLENNPTIRFYEKTGAKFSSQVKQDEIGKKIFNELAYEWESLNIDRSRA